MNLYRSIPFRFHLISSIGRYAAWSLAALGTCFVTAAAHAQDPTAARQLFQEARKAAEANDYKTACPKFDESYRLDPAVGTLLNIAECHRRSGHLATSWSTFQKALEQLPANDVRRPAVQSIVTELENRLPRMSIILKSGSPENTKVERDGTEVGIGSYGIGVPVDPGQHVVIVKAPGRKPKTYDVKIAEQETKEVVVEPSGAPGGSKSSALATDVTPGTAAGPGGSGALPANAPPSVIEPMDSGAVGRSAQKTVGWAVLGVGAAGLLVGSVTGIIVLSKKSTLDGSGNCEDNRCAPSEHDTVFAYNALRPFSTAGFVVGMAGAAVGATLLLTAPQSKETSVSAWVGPASAGLRGKF